MPTVLSDSDIGRNGEIDRKLKCDFFEKNRQKMLVVWKKAVPLHRN
jgi:hypothetical protein